MDFHKLKLDPFSTYKCMYPIKDFNPPLTPSDQPQVYFSFVANQGQLLKTINEVQNNQNHKENRLFIIFEKGNKAFNRDHIYTIVMAHKNIKRKAPILSSLSKEYSVFSFMIEV